ncbi:MAG: TraR/DksA C4-type zinc finger protein [Gammaproteobacteria bacterium]|nr:hypothetical protein [Gammaproteobacteria bacterium]
MNTAARLVPTHESQIRTRLASLRAELLEQERRLCGTVAGAGRLVVALRPERAAPRDGSPQALAAEIREELEQIDAALARLAAGTYDCCEVCGDPIDATRHAIVPFARTCTECALDAEE